MKRLWAWLMSEEAVFTHPGVRRNFMRCKSCGRVFMHYWACAKKGEIRQVGCKCGHLFVEVTRISEPRAAYYLFTRLVWRKWIRGYTYWDPRMPIRESSLGV